jgi:hypothetical protein
LCGKQFSLLWRGGRDGFGAHDFHRRCDGHANTLAVILGTDGNIFGGFTAMKWEYDCGLKADPSLNGFLFTLKSCGPDFCDIGVRDNCHANTDSFTFAFGRPYTHDARLEGKTFFTDSERFRVKEIQVREITD